MKTKFGEVDGASWEKICQQLFRLKYNQGSIQYQEVPDKYGGDLGIEGYTTNGILFQCYCPEENETELSLYEHQRKKITSDINKLEKNIHKIISISGIIKVQEWHFITPKYDNKDILKHCRKKENEIKKNINLYVSRNFKILIKTEDDFISESNYLINTCSYKIPILSDKISKDEIEKIANAQNDIILIIKTKLQKISTLQNDQEKLNKFIYLIFECYLNGQRELETLQVKFPEYYQKIVILKNSVEITVEQLSLTSILNGGEHLKNIQQDYREKIEKDFGKNFEQSLIECLMHEAISDWIVRCPLDF